MDRNTNQKMSHERLIIKNVKDLTPVSTSHCIGLKTVLLSNQETVSPITQIAITTLQSGEKIEVHLHPTMDEYYFFLEGEGVLLIDEKEYECSTGLFFMIPATAQHGIIAKSDMKFMVMGMSI